MWVLAGPLQGLKAKVKKSEVVSDMTQRRMIYSEEIFRKANSRRTCVAQLV